MGSPDTPVTTSTSTPLPLEVQDYSQQIAPEPLPPLRLEEAEKLVVQLVEDYVRSYTKPFFATRENNQNNTLYNQYVLIRNRVQPQDTATLQKLDRFYQGAFDTARNRYRDEKAEMPWAVLSVANNTLAWALFNPNAVAKVFWQPWARLPLTENQLPYNFC